MTGDRVYTIKVSLQNVEPRPRGNLCLVNRRSSYSGNRLLFQQSFISQISQVYNSCKASPSSREKPMFAIEDRPSHCSHGHPALTLPPIEHGVFPVAIQLYIGKSDDQEDQGSSNKPAKDRIAPNVFRRKEVD